MLRVNLLSSDDWPSRSCCIVRIERKGNKKCCLENTSQMSSNLPTKYSSKEKKVFWRLEKRRWHHFGFLAFRASLAFLAFLVISVLSEFSAFWRSRCSSALSLLGVSAFTAFSVFRHSWRSRHFSVLRVQSDFWAQPCTVTVVQVEIIVGVVILWDRLGLATHGGDPCTGGNKLYEVVLRVIPSFFQCIRVVTICPWLSGSCHIRHGAFVHGTYIPWDASSREWIVLVMWRLIFILNFLDKKASKYIVWDY